MRCAETAEIPALHGAREALADAGAGHIHELPRHEMIGRQLRADLDDVLRRHAEFHELRLRLDLRLGEMPALSANGILHLAPASAELKRRIAVRLLRPVRNHLALLEFQHRHGHMLARIGEDLRHANLLCQQSRSHRYASVSACGLRPPVRGSSANLIIDHPHGRATPRHANPRA